MRFIFEGGLHGQRKVVTAEGTSSVAQAEEDHGYPRCTYSSVLLSLSPSRGAFVEGFGAATAVHNPSRSRVKLDAVAQFC